MRKIWTLEKVKAEALKYKHKIDFARFSPYPYTLARKRNILKEICSHMYRKKTIILSQEKITNIALKCKTKKEFRNKNRSAYNKAHALKIIDKICSHMPKDCKFINKPHNFKWDKESVKNICKLFSTKYEFRKHYEGAYQAACVNGWLEELTKHMKTSLMGSSFMEKELLNKIKNFYPSAIKLKDYKVKINKKPYIKRFEVDIYIPELKSGIEFDGDYWHSFKCMREDIKKINWPNKDIKKYHEIKDNYFLSKGIKILHIKEKEWKINKDFSVKKCLLFLENKV